MDDHLTLVTLAMSVVKLVIMQETVGVGDEVVVDTDHEVDHLTKGDALGLGQGDAPPLGLGLGLVPGPVPDMEETLLDILAAEVETGAGVETEVDHVPQLKGRGHDLVLFPGLEMSKEW